MKLTFFRSIIIGQLTLSVILAIAFNCKNNPVATDPPRELELLEPSGGGTQTVKVGDTVTIRWSIHDKTIVQSVGIAYSLDGGITFPMNQFISNKSIVYPDTSYLWVVKSKQVADNFIITIWEYNGLCLSGSCADKPSDRSLPFSVKN